MAGGNGSGDGFEIVAERPIPDVYTDSVRFQITAYGVTIELGQLQPHGTGSAARPAHIPRLRVHMSPQHAKVFGRILVKNMHAYEENVGKLNIPREILEELGILEEGDV